MMKFLSKYRYCLWGAVLIVLDAISKQWALASCAVEQQLTPFLSCEIAYNHGISFGWFAQYGWVANQIFSVILASFVIYLLTTVHKNLENRSLKNSLVGETLVIAGGIGNLIDRFVYGHVIDFIYVHYGQFAFPYYFNLADACIVLGAIYMFIRAINK